jgi:threonine dehydrogenase-like Zn-dependent dehydrogenase
MKAMQLYAEWKPREGYRPKTSELQTKSTYNGNQTFYNPTLSMIDIPVPKAAPDEVLVKVKATGVCGSDVHMSQKDADGYTAYPGHCKFPVVLGHEWSGKIVEVGEKVRSLRPGDLVAVEEMQWCGACTACRSGLFDQCTDLEEIGFTIQGAFSEYVAVKAKHCWSLNAVAEAYGDEDKALEAGAMVEPCCVAYNGMFISAGGFLPGSNVLVAGCGPVGLMGIALARASGAAKVLVMEPSPRRQEMAKRMGADFVFDPIAVEARGLRPTDIIMDETRGDGVMMAIEAAAAGTKTYPIFEETLAPSGKVVQCGMGAERVPISVLRLQWQRLHIHGSVGHTGGIFPHAIRLLAAGRLNLLPMITSRFSLDQAVEAVRTAEKLNDAKVMVRQ